MDKILPDNLDVKIERVVYNEDEETIFTLKNGYFPTFRMFEEGDVWILTNMDEDDYNERCSNKVADKQQTDK